MLWATLAILNANVVTLNPKQPRAEALAVYDGEIVAVGSNEEICKYVGNKTVVVDAEGKAVVPGFG
jgi:predicted amidohydrolase YtcJ